MSYKHLVVGMVSIVGLICSLVSTVTASIVVVSARDGEFRVNCTSTGGRAITMTVSRPDDYTSDLTNNIQPVGTQSWIGNDSYTATTSDIITGGNHRDKYYCMVTGSTSKNGNTLLKGILHLCMSI